MIRPIMLGIILSDAVSCGCRCEWLSWSSAILRAPIEALHMPRGVISGITTLVHMRVTSLKKRARGGSVTIRYQFCHYGHKSRIKVFGEELYSNNTLPFPSFVDTNLELRFSEIQHSMAHGDRVGDMWGRIVRLTQPFSSGRQ